MSCLIIPPHSVQGGTVRFHVNNQVICMVCSLFDQARRRRKGGNRIWSKTCKLTKAKLIELLGRPTEMEYNHIHPNNRESCEAGDY